MQDLCISGPIKFNLNTTRIMQSSKSHIVINPLERFFFINVDQIRWNLTVLKSKLYKYARLFVYLFTMLYHSVIWSFFYPVFVSTCVLSYFMFSILLFIKFHFSIPFSFCSSSNSLVILTILLYQCSAHASIFMGQVILRLLINVL